MPEVWVDGHDFKGGCYVDFSPPSTATHNFNQGNGLVDVMLVKWEFFEWDEAVDARKRRVMLGGMVNYEAFFLSKNILVATPIGLTWKTLKRGTEKGPIIKFSSNSFLIKRSTTSGAVKADWRFGQIRLQGGRLSTPGWKPKDRTVNRNSVNLGLGCWNNIILRRKTFTGVDRYFLAFLLADFCTGHVLHGCRCRNCRRAKNGISVYCTCLC